MNWPLGFRRLAIALGAWVVVWAGICGFCAYRYREAVDAMDAATRESRDMPSSIASWQHGVAENYSAMFIWALALCVLIPILVWVFSPIVIWIYRGFSKVGLKPE